MILIADSGSTKTDWVFLSDGVKTGETVTKGFNPLFTDRDYIKNEIGGNPELHQIASSVKTIHYFGAGCSSDERRWIVESALKDCFPDADCHVDHDMMGCAIALCQGEPGIANILGTGSNS